MAPPPQSSPLTATAAADDSPFTKFAPAPRSFEDRPIAAAAPAVAAAFDEDRPIAVRPAAAFDEEQPIAVRPTAAFDADNLPFGGPEQPSNVGSGC